MVLFCIINCTKIVVVEMLQKAPATETTLRGLVLIITFLHVDF